MKSYCVQDVQVIVYNKMSLMGKAYTKLFRSGQKVSFLICMGVLQEDRFCMH